MQQEVLEGHKHRNDFTLLMSLEGHSVLSRRLSCRVQSRSQEPSEEMAVRNEGGRRGAGRRSGEVRSGGDPLVRKG